VEVNARSEVSNGVGDNDHDELQPTFRSLVTISGRMSDSAIVDSPSPEPGPSSGRYNVEQVFADLDLDAFDWKAYEGTYKGS
jgi:hypothetical protein